ncbi:outer membrane beta-barrel protein [Longimicrobium sp.]|uniref:outer membrane beta-barrel protein n=1 Tax=Longimicrobium sp. TaxID=2029185 RepID=UPI003B3A59EF
MNKTAGFLAAVATVAFASTAQAQICAGFPTSDRGLYFGGRADFPENTDSYGVEANYNFSGPLGVYGGLNVLSADGDNDDEESEDEIYAGLAFEVASLGMMIGPRVSACPVVEARVIDFEGLGTYTQIPIGFGIGAGLGIPMLPSASAYVQPQLVITRVDFDDDLTEAETETETDFGLKAGANVGFGIINVGGEVRHVFVDEADPVFGIRVGVRF